MWQYRSRWSKLKKIRCTRFEDCLFQRSRFFLFHPWFGLIWWFQAIKLPDYHSGDSTPVEFSWHHLEINGAFPKQPYVLLKCFTFLRKGNNMTMYGWGFRHVFILGRAENEKNICKPPHPDIAILPCTKRTVDEKNGPVDIGGKHPIVHRVSTPFWWCRAHLVDAPVLRGDCRHSQRSQGFGRFGRFGPCAVLVPVDWLQRWNGSSNKSGSFNTSKERGHAEI